MQFGIICLTIITPYYAHNLSFNTNVAVPLGILFAVFSVFLLVRNILFTPISVLFSAFAIGIYQSTFQISIVILIIWFLQQIGAQKPYKSFLPRFFLMGIAICLSYLLSHIIADAILTWSGRAPVSLYALSKEPKLIDIVQNAIYLLRSKPLPNPYLVYFYPQFRVLLYSLFGLVTIFILSQFRPLNLILFILAIIAIKIVIELPLLLNIRPGTRAYIHVGWVIAGFFALLQQPRQRIFVVLSRVICVLIFLFSALYISQFYDAARRQTESDIQRIHQIVNRIRLMPEYQSEPIPFVIVGEKSFPVTGSKFDQQQALNTEWSKYNAFRHFTDFDFRQLSEQEQKQVLSKLFTRQSLANYPNKGSIQFVDGTAVLILDISKLPSPENTEPMAEQKIVEE